MPIDQSSAEEVNRLIKEASALCHDSLRVLKSQENLGFVQVYGKLVGQFLGITYTNILAPLWHNFPELKPESMNTPYEEPVAVLSPETRAAIAAFCANMQTSLPQIEKALASCELPYGGFDEVKKAVADIEEFLVKPRFRDGDPLK